MSPLKVGIQTTSGGNHLLIEQVYSSGVESLANKRRGLKGPIWVRQTIICSDSAPESGPKQKISLETPEEQSNLFFTTSGWLKVK